MKEVKSNNNNVFFEVSESDCNVFVLLGQDGKVVEGMPILIHDEETGCFKLKNHNAALNPNPVQ